MKSLILISFLFIGLNINAQSIDQVKMFVKGKKLAESKKIDGELFYLDSSGSVNGFIRKNKGGAFIMSALPEEDAELMYSKHLEYINNIGSNKIMFNTSDGCGVITMDKKFMYILRKLECELENYLYIYIHIQKIK